MQLLAYLISNIDTIASESRFAAQQMSKEGVQ